MNALRALLQVLLSDLRRHRGTALASVLAMAAGVAVFVAILLAGSAARTSFESAVEAIAGKGTHEISRPGGVPQERFAEIAVLEGVESAQPVIEGRVQLVDVLGEGATGGDLPPLRLLGIDPVFVTPFLAASSDDRVILEDDFISFVTEPGTLLLPRRFGEEIGAREGDRLRVAGGGRSVEVSVLGIYDLEVLGEAARDTALVDIATAQEILAREGTIDRIDLILDERGEEVVRMALGPGEELARPERRGARVGKMIEAFRLNLLALGGLALLVGSLLVYSAAQFNVVRRAGLLGQLRCLGTTRSALLFVAVGEVALLGFVGGIVGVGAGAILAQGLVAPVAETVSSLYTFVRADVAPLRPEVAMACILGSVIVASAAAAFPALDAARTPPRLVGVRSIGESRYLAAIPRLAVVSAMALVAGYAVTRIPMGTHWLATHFPGFAASFAFLMAGACLVPPLMAPALPAIRKMAERLGRLNLALAAGAIHRSLTRAGGAAASLGVALSMTIAVIVMVGSFEREVRRWIGDVLTADLYVSDANHALARSDAVVPGEAVERIRRTDGVRSVDTRRSLEVPFRDRTILFNAFDWEDPARQLATRTWLEGGPESLGRLRAGEVLVSEPLSTRGNLHDGDTLTVRGPNGDASFRIAGVIRDYAHDRGYALALADTFVRSFGDPGIRNLGVYVDAGWDPDEVARILRGSLAGEFLLEIRSNAELRAEVMRIFDRTFAITYVLQVIATVMALSGIAVTLVGLFLERTREIATLRAIGASAARVGHLFAAESLLLAAFPILLALPLGALLAWVLIDVVNLRSFGWSFPYHWPWRPVLATCALAAVAGLAATVVPVILARRQSIASALREE